MSTSLADELETYHGNCHCGAVRFTIRTPSLSTHEVSSCNCSICTRNGYLMIYPAPENVTFQQGFDNLKEFYFGSQAFVHRFCKTCGSSVNAAMSVKGGGEMLAINVRMLQGIHPEDLKLKFHDGKAYGAPYTYPVFPIPAFPDADANPKLVEYPGNCQCGTVTFTMRAPSFADNTPEQCWQCNCSICDRNGYLFVYPPQHDVIFHTGYDSLSEYTFNTKRKPHKFCGTCGSSIFLDKTAVNDGWAMNVWAIPCQLLEFR
ncbi:hypothetical protein HWV62_33825 [Athelia sp. TMB]|nr:hypothetical protein HWV62_33825 [Athelia sp. TMB]